MSDKNFEIANLLLKYGALENLINLFGLTPWQCFGKML